MRHHGHGHREHGPERRTSRRLRFRLQRQLFWWAGITIFVTGGVTFVVVHAVAPASPFREDIADSARAFVARRFADVWDRPDARRSLAEELSGAFGLNVKLEDDEGRELLRFGSGCRYGTAHAAVERGRERLGRVEVCFAPERRFGGAIVLLGLAAAIATLWAASAWFARRLARPFIDLVRVTREIGEGRLSSRMQLGRHHVGEAAVLAEAINDMASRIERQIEGQRELLAAVSHELRSPLTRLRVLVELAEQQGDSAETRRNIEREVVEIDALVAKLLANSRLDFEVIDFQRLGAGDVVRRALERAGLPSELFDGAGAEMRFDGDATLVARALGNLLENAARHAGGAEHVLVSKAGGSLRFAVLDRGPGFSDELRRRAFEPFVRGKGAGKSERYDGGALGLGLSLVARIARAHGGRAFAENREGGGASVVLELPLDQAGNRRGTRGIDSTGSGR